MGSLSRGSLIIVHEDTAENEVTRMYTLRPPEIRQRLLLFTGDKRLMRGPLALDLSRSLRREIVVRASAA